MARVMADSEAAGMERLVLLVMSNRAGGDRDECFASTDRLAFECRVDVRTVQRAIKRLVKLGDLVKIGVHAKYRTNIYEVMPVVRVAESHPPGAGTPPAPPERKERKQSTSEEGADIATPAVRPPDPAFNALAAETGHELTALTRSSAQTIGVKLAEIAVAEGARLERDGPAPHDEELAEEIRYRAERYRRLHADWQLTPGSLAKHWPTLGARPVRIDRAPTVTELRAAIPDDQYDPGEPVSEQYARLKRDRSKA